MTLVIGTRAFAARWSDLDAWDIKAAAAAAFRAQRQSFRPFGDFIDDRTELVRPNLEPDKLWPVYGVSNQAGAFLSHCQAGSKFRSPYKRIRKDWFFHNPTRANVGSFARVPAVEPDAITSPEYQVWAITDHNWSPDFVEILLQLPLFMAQVQVHRVGGVKQRLYVDNLRRIPVPVLRADQQAIVVDTWRDSVNREVQLRARAASAETDAAAEFLAELGLQAPGIADRRAAFAVRWSDMSRWAVAANRARGGGTLESGIFPLMPLSELIDDLENGWSPKCLARPAADEEWGVLKVGAVSTGRYDPSENKALPPALRPEPRLEVHAGDLLIGRANISRLVGASALIGETPPHLMLSDKIFRVRWSPQAKIDPSFLDCVLKLPHLRAIMEAAATGSSPTMKNISKPALLALPIPTPPLSVQRNLAKTVSMGRENAASLATAAEAERQMRIHSAERQVLTMAAEYAGEAL